MTKYVVPVIGLIILAVVSFLVFRGGAPLKTAEFSDNEKSSTNSAMLGGGGVYDVTTSDITYHESAKGFYAKPNDSEQFPGVILVHEWWGLNQNIKDMAKQLASEGYHVLAVDLYNGKVAGSSDEAMQLVTSIDQTKANANMTAALNFLKSQGATKLAAMGWCFGGGQTMQLSISGQKLDATVIYYGNLVTDKEKLKVISWPVLGIFGETDESIPVGTVKHFETALGELGIAKEVHIYPGVGHAFANPSGQNYAAEATKDAWEKTLAFLEQTLKS